MSFLLAVARYHWQRAENNVDSLPFQYDQDDESTAITPTDKDGTSTEVFGYDANDEVTTDTVSRGGVVGNSTACLYDALGRVYQAKGSHGQRLTHAYDGSVLSVTDCNRTQGWN